MSSDDMMMEGGVMAFQLLVIDLGSNRERTYGTCCEAALSFPQSLTSLRSPTPMSRHRQNYRVTSLLLQAVNTF